MIYVTTPNEEEAAHIAETLVQEHLVACANVFPPIRSFYRWEGKVQDDREVVFVAKTTRLRADDVIRRIRELHSYEVPAILAIPILAGNSEYLRWVEGECMAGEA